MQLITVDDPNSGQEEFCRALERGDILFFPCTPILAEEDRKFLLGIELTDAGYHKNIAYRPNTGKVTGFAESQALNVARLRSVLHAYSERALKFMRELLPRYAAGWRVDFASFRPQEEEGRQLPVKKRNDLLHTDAFPTRPTRGDLILRLFTNIHPEKSRVWLTGDPFALLAPQYAEDAGLRRLAAQAESPWTSLQRGLVGMLRAAGLPVVDRTPYDRFMLRFHDYLKYNQEYQEKSVKYRFEFPPGSTWMVFTDIVPHAVLSGRYALEQTVIVARQSLASPESAPVAILEKLSQSRLA
jgi:hypothetical protein